MKIKFFILVREGVVTTLDPGEVKRREKLEMTERGKNTFEAVARAWMEVHSTKVKPKTLHIYMPVLEKFVFPIIDFKYSYNILS